MDQDQQNNNDNPTEPQNEPTVETTDGQDGTQGGNTTDVTQETVSEVVADELDGFTLAGSTTANHEDGEEKIPLENLKAKVIIEHLNGVSCALDRAGVDSPYGVLRLRLIADNGGRAFVYRNDTEDVTTLKVSFKHQVL